MRPIRTALTILIFLFSLSSYAQKKNDVVCMKITQNYLLLKTDSYILISYPDETTKVIALAKAGFRIDDAEEDANTKLIQKTINSIIEAGYQIVSTSITGDYQCKWTLMTFSRTSD